MQSRLRWLFFFITLLSIVLMAARVPLDTDMWWHVRAGQVSIENGAPLLQDTFSYTKSGADWINHSWLAEVVIVFLYQALGYYGLTLFVVLLSLGTFGILYFLIDGHAFIKAILVIIAGTLVSTVWSPRPQLFTLFFLILLVFLVTRYFQGKIKHLWGVPVLFMVWGNLHGGYFTGILFLVMLLLGIGYDLFLSKNEVNYPISNVKHFLLVTVVSIPALLINPNGFDILKIPFSTVGVDILRNFIDEWSSPDFHEPLQMGFVLLLFLFIFFISTTKTKFPAKNLFPILGFGILAFYAKRNIAPFVLVFMPLFAVTFIEWLQTLRFSDFLVDLTIPSVYSIRIKDDNPIMMRIVNLFLVFMMGILAAGKLVYVSYPSVVDTYLAQSTPVEAYQLYSEMGTKGNLLNEYGWGGYQIAHYEDMPVFVDGRTDLFGDEIIGQWITLMRAADGYQALLEKYDITAVLLQNDRPLINELLKQGWKEVYKNAQGVLLVESE
jgi:hypothetical protein